MIVLTGYQYFTLLGAVWLAPNCPAKVRLLLSVVCLGLAILSKVI